MISPHEHSNSFHKIGLNIVLIDGLVNTPGNFFAYFLGKTVFIRKSYPGQGTYS